MHTELSISPTLCFTPSCSLPALFLLCLWKEVFTQAPDGDALPSPHRYGHTAQCEFVFFVPIAGLPVPPLPHCSTHPLAWPTFAHFFLLWLSPPPVGEKPFSCSLCPQRSRDFSAMTKHLRTHGAAPYRCPLCRAGCPSLASMQAHMRGHSPSQLPPGWTIRSTFLYSSSRPTRASVPPGSPASSSAT